MRGSIISLSKIAHQMWRDHPYSQRNKATKRAVEVGWSWGGGWGWVAKFNRNRGRG